MLFISGGNSCSLEVAHILPACANDESVVRNEVTRVVYKYEHNKYLLTQKKSNSKNPDREAKNESKDLLVCYPSECFPSKCFP